MHAMASFARALLASTLTACLAAPSVAHAQATPPAAPGTDAASAPPDKTTWHVEADPPLLPPPGSGPEPGALSTSGSDVRAAEEPVPALPADAALAARVAALESELASRRGRENARPESWLSRHLKIGGFVQPQLYLQTVNAAASPNQLGGSLPAGISPNDVVAQPDGTSTNRNAFRMRRTRLRTTFETDEARLYLQIEALPFSGEAPTLSTVLRNAEATGKIRWSRDVRTEVTAGLFMVPLRYELVETSNVRPYVERTTFARAVVPLERDLGVHARTTALDERLTVDVAVVNGQRLGEPKFAVQPDLNSGKDVVLWASYRYGAVTFGGNGYLGRGQIVDAQNLRFKQYGRWAANAFVDVAVVLAPRLGATHLLSELTFGENMDAGTLYPAAVPRIPASFGADVDDVGQRAFYVRLEQDLGRIATVGYRYDVYHPDTRISGNSIGTHSLLASARFSRHLRWNNELTYSEVNLTDARTLAFSSVLQAQF